MLKLTNYLSQTFIHNPKRMEKDHKLISDMGQPTDTIHDPNERANEFFRIVDGTEPMYITRMKL